MKAFLVIGTALGFVGVAVTGAHFSELFFWKRINAEVPSSSQEVSGYVGPVSFNHTIQPILSTNCYACHGPDASTREANLRLDQREFALLPAESGQPAILEHNLAASPLIERIVTADPMKVMPPPGGHSQLDPRERALLVQWVKEGAVYEDHWAFLPPVRAEPPAWEGDSWSRSAIDQFVLAELRARGLEPNGPESPASLIRRVSLDLTGLLPDPAEAAAFAEDPSDEAYEALVEKLLASPRFGEHRGRYWLDYARYADTHGLHFDNFRSIWPYRDYVVRSFNDNKPFDQFVREQLAGDLMPDGALDALIATGYIRSNVSTNEGGAITEEVINNNTRDRAEAFGTTFLGLTVACAECHDHKFDPTTAQDFFQLSAFFKNLTEVGWDFNIAEPPPILRLPPREDKAEAEAILRQMSAARAELRELQADGPNLFRAALVGGKGPRAVSEDKLELRLRLDEGQGDIVRNSAPENMGEEFIAHSSRLIWGEQSLLWEGMRMDMNSRLPLGDHGDFDGDEAFSAGGWFMIRQKPGNIRASRGALLSRMGGPDNNAHRGWDIWVQDNKFGFHLIHHWPDRAIKVVTKEAFPNHEWVHVFVTYDGSRQAENVKVFINGEPKATEVERNTLVEGGTTRNQTQVQLGRRDDVSPVREARYQDIRMYRRLLGPEEVARLPFEDYAAEIVAEQPDFDAWSTDQRFVVLDQVLMRDHERARYLNRRLGELGAAYDKLTQEGTPTLVAREKASPAYAHILNRGVYNDLGARVEPGTPSFLPPLPEGRRPDRLALADWVVSPENPLLARVTVNRMWQEVFGRGIVRSPGDFGIVGERPSHPELLDWLAVEFRENGWDVKQIYRQLVLSATYRQSSRVSNDSLETDPFNYWYARAPRFRMDAEMIRDSALQSAGLLVQKLGGPPVKPYQPPGVWEAVSMPGSTTETYRQDSGEGLYRRSVYTFWKRFAPPPSLETFDARSREVVCAERPRTNTPLQALVMMNDPQFVEASRILAESAVQNANDASERLDHLSQVTLARALDEREQAALLASLARFEDHFHHSPEDALALLTVGEAVRNESLAPSEVAAWTMVANQFFNLDEFLTK
jgi:mono/diheme cytochrome c family protein